MRLKAITAVAMMLLFYALALSLIGALLWAGSGLGHFTVEHLRGRAAFLAAFVVFALYVAAAIVSYSLLPRFDRFKPPGPELEKKTHPALFREIERLAAATGERPPVHVYLVGEVNAFVSQRGGVLGIGSRRVMGIGLPLLSALSVAELRAVLGHEFGHFSGGDTRLGAWVYRARVQMIEMVRNLDDAQMHSQSLADSALLSLFFAALRAPFHAFALRYIRFTAGLSRLQEHAADQIGASVAGSAASISALQRVRIAASTFQHFLDRDVTPVVRTGHLPPVADGFRRFLADQSIDQLGKQLVTDMLADDREADPHDSHPPLAERVAALKAAPCKGWGDSVGSSALELLADVARCEQEVMAFMLAQPRALKRVQWAEAGRLVAARWKSQARTVVAALKVTSLTELPAGSERLRSLVEEVQGRRVPRLTEVQVRRQAGVMFDVLVFAALSAMGWTTELKPAQPVRFSRGDEVLEPEALVTGLLTGTATAHDVWVDFCIRTGLADFDLALLVEEEAVRLATA
jgi:Zn-dependent protease with chaperone function